MKPARSYSPSVYSPGISAVSPPISAQPFCRQPRAIPRHHRRRHVRIQLPHREVIQKEQRRRPLHRDVVHAVVHQVFADRVVPPRQERHLQLRAHAVGGAHQHRLAIPRQLVHRAEAPDLGQHSGRKRLPRKLLDGGNGAVGLVDIHARVAVANWFLVRQIPVYGVECRP